MVMALLVFSSLSTILIRQYKVLLGKIGDYHPNPNRKTKVKANRRSKNSLQITEEHKLAE